MRMLRKFLMVSVIVVVVPLSIVGGCDIWRWCRDIVVTFQEPGFDESLLEDGSFAGFEQSPDSSGSPVVVVVLTNQPLPPESSQLIDEPYEVNVSDLISLCTPIMKLRGRLKPGEVRREGKIRLYMSPGGEANLYVPVKTAAAREGWRVVPLTGVECVFQVPTHTGPASHPRSLVARD